MKHPKYYDTDEVTSRRMAKVKHERGPEEIMLAKALWHEGYRYWLNYKKLPGSPDIAIQKHQIAIFVDGEYWHGCGWEEKRKRIHRNREYWIEKIEENIARDKRVDKELMLMGWTPTHLWSRDIRKNLEECVQSIKECVLEEKLNRS